MPDDGPRNFELENTFGKFRLRAKQPAQLAVLAPAAGSRRPTRRRPLGSISRDSLLWTAHDELAAQQRHGRLRWSTSPLVSTGPSLHLTRLSRGTKAKEGSPGQLSVLSVPPGTVVPTRDPPQPPTKELPCSISALELTSPDPSAKSKTCVLFMNTRKIVVFGAICGSKNSQESKYFFL